MADATPLSPPVLVCLTPAGAELAARLAGPLEAEIHGRAGRTETPVAFAETTAHLRDLFAAGRPIVGLCAAGILVRAIAPLIADKAAEPPVLALAEDGSAVVPLLGGHRGANRLARKIAELLGIGAAITTAGDLSLGVALDAPPPGWRVANPDDAPAVMAAAVAGAEITLAAPEGSFLAPLMGAGACLIAPPADETIQVRVSGQPRLTYRATTLTLGVGCARGCDSGELSHLVEEALKSQKLVAESLAGVFSLDLKADEAAVLDLAERVGVPARFFPATRLEAETPRLATPSDVVFAEVGCHGVAEAAALAAAGPDAQLIVKKRKSASATVAIARAPAPIVSLPGRPRGQVSLIGLGPGRADWRAPQASRLIAEADELVGYGLYLDLIGPLAHGKVRADFPLGGEEDRCRHALEQAGTGRQVALICSGDAGIYAMGALIYELLARPGCDPRAVSDAARRVEIVTAPGITAMQAAAAKAGAPLGHDFCAISLSDLLTPRKDIENRVRAAAEGDFVTAFYNPVSQRRRALFVEAIETFRAHRPASTPVIVARSLGRLDETLSIRNLSDITVDEVDMMTVVIVGSSQTSRVCVGGRDRIFTPRGYAAKHREPAE